MKEPSLQRYFQDADTYGGTRSDLYISIPFSLGTPSSSLRSSLVNSIKLAVNVAPVIPLNNASFLTPSAYTGSLPCSNSSSISCNPGTSVIGPAVSTPLPTCLRILNPSHVIATFLS